MSKQAMITTFLATLTVALFALAAYASIAALLAR